MSRATAVRKWKEGLNAAFITLAIFGIVWQSARAVGTRMLDGVEPGVLDEIRHAAEHVPGLTLHQARAPWVGHRLHADLIVSVEIRRSPWRTRPA